MNGLDILIASICCLASYYIGRISKTTNTNTYNANGGNTIMINGREYTSSSNSITMEVIENKGSYTIFINGSVINLETDTDEKAN